jgi:GntR family transcriptional regulator
MRARGTAMSVAKQRIGARRAVGDEAALLEIDKGGPLLTMERIVYDNSGHAVEVGRHCYRPDLYSFEITLVDR